MSGVQQLPVPVRMVEASLVKTYRCPKCARTNIKRGIVGFQDESITVHSMDGGDVWQCRDCRYDDFLDSGNFDDNCPKGCMAVGIMSERQEM